MTEHDEVITACTAPMMEQQLNAPAGRAVLGRNPNAVAGDVVRFMYLRVPVALVVLRKVDHADTPYQPTGYWLAEDVQTRLGVLPRLADCRGLAP